MKSRIRLLYCLLFGHEFNEHWENRDDYKGRQHLIEWGQTCSVCGLSYIDKSGMIRLYDLKQSDLMTNPLTSDHKEE